MPDQAPQDPSLVRNRSASGGINTFSSPLDIKDDECVDLTNGIATVPGIREVRPGSSVIASGITHGPILALQEFTPTGFVTELLAVTPGATYPNAAHLRLWKWSGTGNWSAVGALSGMTSATLPVDIIPFLDLNVPGTYGPSAVRISNRQTLDYNWIYANGGITVCTGPSVQPTTGMFPLGVQLSRMFGGGREGTSRGKLFYSDVGSALATGWASAQSFTMGGGSRQEIIAIKPFRSADVMVFMQDRIDFISLGGDPIQAGGSISTNLWSRGSVDATIGCGSRRTVQTVGEDLFFVDQHGNVRSLARTITDNSQGTKSLPVSAKIQSWIDRVNVAALDQAQASSYDRYYVVSFPVDSSTFCNKTFVYDVVNEAWYGPWDGPWGCVSTLAVATLNNATAVSDQSPTLYIGSATAANGIVHRTFSGTSDNGSAIVYQETTRRETFGTLEARKVPRRIRVYALPSPGATLRIEARSDGGAYRVVGDASMAGGSPQLPLTGPIDLTGSGVVEAVKTLEDSFQNAMDLQFRMTCTASSEIQILGYTVQAHLKNVDWQVN